MQRKNAGLYQSLRTVRSDSDFKSKALVQQLLWSHPTNRACLRGCSCSVHCGRRWRQSLLGSSSWGQRAMGKTAHCSKINSYILVLPLLYWFCCRSDPLLSFLVHLRQFSYCYWDKPVLGEGQQIPELKWGEAVGSHIQDREEGKVGRPLYVAANH